MNFSIFDDNHAPDGAAVSLAYYGAKFENVTFRSNAESAIRVSLLLPTLVVKTWLHMASAKTFLM